MTVYRCPRRDLRCSAEFGSAGDLDYHFRMIHGYRRFSRYVAAFRPTQASGPRPQRRVPDDLPEGTGTPTLSEEIAARHAGGTGGGGSRT